MVQNLIYNLCESFVKNIDGIASITKNTPPQEEILAPVTFEVTLNYADEYYWATFYTSMANYQAPDGVRVYKVNLNGSQFTTINVEDGIINKRQGVVLRSSTSSITLTKTYSKSSDDYSNNSLIGTDYQITNPGNAYGLNYKQSHGLSFYRFSSTGKIKANTAYLIRVFTYLTQWKIVGNSEVHTLPYPDGIVLPNGYKRCEYLTFDGDSYINTGIKTANDIGYNLTCSNSNYTARILIGARTNATLNGFGLGFGYVGYGGATALKNISYPSSKVNVLLDSTQCKIGNDNYDISDIRATATAFFDIYVGTWNQDDIPDWRMWIGNIYDTIIYNTQGELWHGIPCLDANDVPCFYDLVSETAFYNQGSGSFTYKLYPQPTEIWSCGEYNATDGKYHILVQPSGGSIADIALTEPLRKVNDATDTIEFPSGTEGKALVTRCIFAKGIDNNIYARANSQSQMRWWMKNDGKKWSSSTLANILSNKYSTVTANQTWDGTSSGVAIDASGNVFLFDLDYIESTDKTALIAANADTIILYELNTPTTELVDAPQIQEADSYSMVISQGGKAVSWSSFETE